MKVLSILLADTSPLFRSALVTVLKKIGASVTVCGLTQPIEKNFKRVDVVLVDTATFSGDDELLAVLVQGFLKIAPVLLLAREDRMDQVIICLKVGATGLVSQTASQQNLRDAIRAVASGFVWCECKLFRSLTRYLLPVSQRQQPRLTRREEEVLRCITQGQGNKEIAACLGISEQSVKVYVSNLLRKVGVSSRGLLVLHAMARGPGVA